MPTKKQLLTVFFASVFVSNAWALYNITQEIPAWILRLSIGEMVGVIAHNLYLALLDALPIFFILVPASLILPAAWLKNRFVSIGSTAAVFAAVWLIYFHSNGQMTAEQDVIALGLWAGSYLIVFMIAYLLILRSDRTNQMIQALVERLALLAGIYIVFDLVSLVIVLVRNMGGV